MDAGAEQTNTTFVFMNSDFIVADGSLATLGDKIRSGHRCIVAPSLRASAERLTPDLRRAVSGTNSRSSHARSLVWRSPISIRLCSARLGDQDEFHCMSFNQSYWRPNKSTLLGRYHLLFMLCIRPERPLGPVNSYCDYGLIPELVPSSPMVPLTDSDEFFMLELGPDDQEDDLLRVGPAKLNVMAGSLRRWTTKEHRQSAAFDFVFHSGPLPQSLGRVSKDASSFIERLHARMGSRPISHVHHHYWIRGLQHWLRAKATGPAVQFPPELAGGRLEKWLAQYARLDSRGCRARRRTCQSVHMTGTTISWYGDGFRRWANCRRNPCFLFVPKTAGCAAGLRLIHELKFLNSWITISRSKKFKALPIYPAPCPCKLPAQAWSDVETDAGPPCERAAKLQSSLAASGAVRTGKISILA